MFLGLSRKADLDPVARACRPTIERASQSKLGPSFPASLPDKPGWAIGRLMGVSSQSERAKDCIIEGEHGLDVICPNHNMAEHLEPHPIA